MYLGIARSASFMGSCDIYPAPIVSPEFGWDREVTAPNGIIQDGKMRLWFHGVRVPNYWPWVIGYAEADFPLDWNYSVTGFSTNVIASPVLPARPVLPTRCMYTS